jgi:hypothetical protein
VIAYAVPGAIALIGVYLGKLWEHRGGTASWRRDRRLAAYSDALATAQAFWALATRANRGEDTQAEMRVHFHEFTRHQSVVDLLGPDAAAVECARWRSAHAAVFFLLFPPDESTGSDRFIIDGQESSPRVPGQTVLASEQGVSFLQARSDFLAAARRALK